ncbi:KEOPS complex subunit Cgi121 [Halococcoides cellulosivorans]|uniref:KEOPS complex component n=1 Tax=Halococcoides cellulosivorans TaxID=1679096 RepID=A0A2R4X1R0_9EURY|nr:KEOPS complex subunit Cgi121 [Halococcoides cellulosivorans]AWB27736.1 KEOPS complex component [Halococcoides cellulosivorans]
MAIVTGRFDGHRDRALDSIAAIDDAHDGPVQAIDARYLVGREHLTRAVELAERERAAGDAIARDPAVEILLYAAGRRQIDRALEMGLDSEAHDVAVVAPEAAIETLRAADWLDPGPVFEAIDRERVRSYFEISDSELAATRGDLTDLVLERVALLVVDR